MKGRGCRLESHACQHERQSNNQGGHLPACSSRQRRAIHASSVCLVSPYSRDMPKSNKAKAKLPSKKYLMAESLLRRAANA